MSLEEFRRLEVYWELEEDGDGDCPMCGGLLTFYSSKYVDGVEIRFCYNCHELEDGSYLESTQPNICPICHQIIRFDEEDYLTCGFEGCEQKVHSSCAVDEICDNCNMWACEQHDDSVIQCDRCGLNHTEDCIVSFDSEFVDEFGHVCKKCFDRYGDLIEQIKKPFETDGLQHIIERIERDKKFYIEEARENFDLTVALTHLIKSDNPFGLLKRILDEKCLKSSQTGYFGKKDNTQAVCFADLTVRGLLRHSKKYSPFGLAFLKQSIYERGGGPALYVRENIIREENNLTVNLKPFINKINLNSYDFHHEREWRVAQDFLFDYNEIFILYAPIKYHDEIRKMYPEIRILLDLDLILLI